MQKKMKFTGIEWRWILYDVGNSAVTLLFTTLLPIYFASVAAASEISESDYLAYWGYTIAFCTLLVAILGPILGAFSDRRGAKKRLFILAVIIGALGLAALSLPQSWVTFLILFAIARVGYQSSLIFYDAMLTDITVDTRMNDVSSYGYALGYIGSVIPFVLSLAVVLGGPRIGLAARPAMAVAILINALWWIAFTVPLLRKYEQTHSIEATRQTIGDVFRRLGRTLRDLYRYKKLFFFLLAFFFYIDGVYTIIDMATAYGTSLGLNTEMLLIALLVTQIVAFPAAIAFSVLARRYSPSTLITVAIIGYTLIASFAIQLDQEWEFWFLAVMVGLFQGGIQAMSRAYYARLIPPQKSGEYFGLYDIFGKGAALLGTTLVATISKVTGRQNLGIAAITVIFVIGLILFRIAVRTPETKRR